MERLAVKPSEAARMLDVSRPTLYQWMNRQDFPVVRIGGCVRIPVDDLREWVKAQKEVREGAASEQRKTPAPLVAQRDGQSRKSTRRVTIPIVRIPRIRVAVKRAQFPACCCMERRMASTFGIFPKLLELIHA